MMIGTTGENNYLKNYLAIFVSLFLFRLTLDLCYYKFVWSFFSYSGFSFSFMSGKYVFSIVLFSLVFLFLNKNLKKSSDFFLYIFAVFVIAPLSTVYGLSNREIYPLLVSIFAFFVVAFFTKLPIKLLIPPIIKQGRTFVIVLSIIFVFLLAVWYYFSGATQYFNLDLRQVYDFREDSSRIANVGILAYLNNWVLKVFSVFLLAVALHKKNVLAIGVMILLHVFFFGVTANKSILFQPFLITGIYVFFDRYKNLTIIPYILILLIILCLLMVWVFDNILFASLFVRRVFFVPALLTYQYFDFFSNNDFVYWGNSFLSNFIDYNYEQPISKLIGQFTGTDQNANNGFISSGYAQAGFLGVFLYALILGILLRFIDKVSRDLPLWFSISLTVILIRSAIVASDLLIVLLTHGLLMAVIVLIVSRPSKKSGISFK